MCTGAGWPSLGAFYPLNHIRPPLVKQNPHFRHYFTSAPYRAQSAAGLWTERESAPSRREAKDRAACGAKAVKAANELIAKRGLDGCLTLSDETRPMTGGLILKQGDIEVNCTVDTLLDLSRSELAARVAEVLFEG